MIAEEKNTDMDFSVLCGKRVLMVEDNEIGREMLGEILRHSGMLPDEVCDGSDAVQLLSEKPDLHYDIILMDIMMPRMDGFEATKEIRRLQKSSSANTPIIAVTSADTDEIKAMGDTGMNACLSKPVDVGILLNTIKSFLS